MFDQIKTHIDPYRGPAQGEGTEHGDTWPTAIRKINDGFANIVAWIESFDPDATAKATEAPLTAQEVGNIVQRALQPLQDQLNEVRRGVEVFNAKLEISNQIATAVDGLTWRVDALQGFFNAEAPPPNLPQEIEPDPKMPPPEDGAALDPDGKPATGTDPVPQS